MEKKLSCTYMINQNKATYVYFGYNMYVLDIVLIYIVSRTILSYVSSIAVILIDRAGLQRAKYSVAHGLVSKGEDEGVDTEQHLDHDHCQ